jgi:helix-turn-helix protein
LNPQLNKERLLAKGKFYFLLEASGKDVRFTDNEWTIGFAFLTDKHIWFFSETTRAKIALDSITFVGRREYRSVATKLPIDYTKVLVIDYGRRLEDGTMGSFTTLVYGAENALNLFKRYVNETLNPALKSGPDQPLEPNESEKRLLLLIYLGMKDMDRIAFILGTDREGLNRMLDHLTAFAFLDGIGNLTKEGLAYSSRLGKTEKK